jgi:Holliday junction resolvasome RuvABC endonuclease subunit
MTMPPRKLRAPQKRLWIDYNFELFDERYKKNPYIIGMDFSLTSTGYVVLDSSTGTLVKSGVFKTAVADGTLRERLFKIFEQFQELFKAYPCSVVSYEMISVFSNPTSSIRLAMVLGLMYNCVSTLIEESPYIISLATTSLKKAATASGKSDKNLIIKSVYQQWGADFNSDDVADAYVAARVAFEANKIKELYFHFREKTEKELGPFLIDVEKGRFKSLNDELEKLGITRHMYEVVVSLMGSKTQAQENDYEYYQTKLKEIVQKE